MILSGFTVIQLTLAQLNDLIAVTQVRAVQAVSLQCSGTFSSCMTSPREPDRAVTTTTPMETPTWKLLSFHSRYLTARAAFSTE